MSFEEKTDAKRSVRQDIAKSTLKAIEAGSYTLNRVTYDLSKQTKESEHNTQFYNYNDPDLSKWRTTIPSSLSLRTQISILEISTLSGARHLRMLVADANARIGILNFASAKKPGGGFLSGAQAQEESIARSSNLYPTLMTSTAQQFYKLHKATPKGGFYSHSMIFSPGVVVFKDDQGNLAEPLKVEVVTSPAVNAGLVRKTLLSLFAPAETEEKIAIAMEDRMGRILHLFEKQGVRNVVLGSFGTGVFKNKVDMVAEKWANLFTSPRFRHSFDRVVFAILGRETFDVFKITYEEKVAADGSTSQIQTTQPLQEMQQ